MRITLLRIFVVLVLTSCNRNKKNDTELRTSHKSQVVDIVGQGRIYPLNEIVTLASPVDGVVMADHRKENDSVKSGEILIEFDHAVETARVHEEESKLVGEQALLESDMAGLKESEVKYYNKEQRALRMKKLLESDAETLQNYEDAEAESASLNATVDKLKAVVLARKASIVQAESELSLAKAELQQKFIRAPANGVILQMDAPPGTPIRALQQVIQFVPDGPEIADCEIDELFADQVKSGQKAIVRDVVSQDTITTGTVYFVSEGLSKKSIFSDNAGNMEDRKVRRVKIKLDGSKFLLFNTRVECVISTEK